MMADGELETRRKRLQRRGALPHVSVLDIIGRDGDGDLIARPVEWDEDDAPPMIRVRHQARARGRTPAPGVGERILARIFEEQDEEGAAYSAEPIKVLQKRAETVLGILRETAGGGWRMQPGDRKQPELAVAADRIGEAPPGDLTQGGPQRNGRSHL